MAEDMDLLPGEIELLHVNRHWVVLARKLVLPLAVGAIAIGVGAALRLNPPYGTYRWFILLVGLIALLVYADIRYIIWRSETVTLTDQRVLLRRGVFGKYSRSIGMQRVQDVTTAQGFMGRIFNYGTVEVESAARDGAEILDHVPDPREFRNVLFEHLRGGVPPTQGL
ncbi:MAG: PH domain-containing protein [Candidatus Dormibacteria bacterium]